jgi:hypothetical protein
MPLEISEIGIHVRVPDETCGSAAPPAGHPAGDTAWKRVESARMVDECVRRVLQVLAMRAER